MPLPHTPRLTPPRPWSPLTDAQWHALLPHILPLSPAGRRIADLRARMNAIFRLTHTAAPWRHAAAEGTSADTVARHFRRLTHGGLWERLLIELAHSRRSDPLRQIEHLIVRACRRAHRILGPGFLILIRRLGLRSALNGPPWMLPDPDLSETLLRIPIPLISQRTAAARRTALDRLRALRHLLRAAAGRARIPRTVRLAWP